MPHAPTNDPPAGSPTRTVRTRLALLVLCFGLAACGSTAKKSAGSPETTTAATSQDSGTRSSTPATSGKAPAPVKVCSVLPVARAASLSGKALTNATENDYTDGNAYTCNYYPSSGVGGVTITVTTTGGATAYKNMLQNDTVTDSVEHVTTVSGLGDKAFSARDGLHALFGDRLILVAGLSTVPPAKAIVLALQAKLP